MEKAVKINMVRRLEEKRPFNSYCSISYSACYLKQFLSLLIMVFYKID